jgi:hypothetical protein
MISLETSVLKYPNKKLHRIMWRFCHGRNLCIRKLKFKVNKVSLINTVGIT